MSPARAGCRGSLDEGFHEVRAAGGRAVGAPVSALPASPRPDPDAHCDRPRATGALIVRELTDEPYGSREYSARDLEGDLWSFGTYDPRAHP